MAHENESRQADALTGEEYRDAVALVLSIVRTVFPLPLRSMLASISRAEAVGPLLDPTLYRDAGSQMSEFKQLVQKLRAFQLEVERQAADQLKAGGKDVFEAHRRLQDAATAKTAQLVAEQMLFAGAQIPPMAPVSHELGRCLHDQVLTMGKEEVGGRRFPVRWCQRCGAISLDVDLPHPETGEPRNVSGWLVPERHSGTSAANRVLGTMRLASRKLTEEQRNLLFDAMEVLASIEPGADAD